MIIHEVKQGTPEWLALRLGKFTASNADSLLMDKNKAGYESLVNEIVFERITGESPEDFKSKWMERGNEIEAQARTAYMLQTGNWVDEVGFIEYDNYTGASPDGFIGDDGLLEIKSPSSSTLIKYHLSGIIPTNYYQQIQMQLYVSGRKWCDYWVYYPHPEIKPIRKCIVPDLVMFGDIKRRLGESILEVQKRIKILKG